MSTELIKKAYEHFNGVWPYDDGDSMIISGKLNSTWGEGQYAQTDAESENHFKFFYGHHLWKWVGTKSKFDAYGESLKEEWTPEVGQECEFKYKKHETKFKVGVAKFVGNKLIVIDTGYEQCYHIESLDFRPLKTEDEKQADEMWDIVKDATDTYHACELLVKNGFKKCAG